MSSATVIADGAAAPRLVVVAGSGRSGTSTVSGVLSLLGLHIPQPEVPGTRSNPLGHFEPQWAVDFQQRLLVRARVRLADPRPEAFSHTREIGLRDGVQEQLRDWLGEQLAIAPEIVVKDPRNSWFLPMWRAAAHSLSVAPCYLTMLRHPAEVLASKNSYYHPQATPEERRTGDTERLAGWINVGLFTEQPTREECRVFVRYADLLADWRATMASVAKTLDLSLKDGFDDLLAARVEEFVDPELHRVKVTWDDVDVPPQLQQLAEVVWEQLNLLADAAGHDVGAEAALDGARRDYERMYADAYALTSSGVAAAVQSQLTKAVAQATAAHPPAEPTSRPRVAVSRGRRVLGRAKRKLLGRF